MPVGVIVQNESRGAPATTPAALAGRLMIPVRTVRGPVSAPTLVRSLNEFETIFGSRQSYTLGHDQLATFFAEGGGEAVVVRRVGAAATTGSKDLNDRAGSPVPTLKVLAASPGAWATDLSYTIANGTVTNTFTLSVYYLGTLVETWVNLLSPADAVTKLAGSQYVRGQDLSSATTAPNNNPAVAASPVALVGGGDDRAAVTPAIDVAGLDLITSEFGTGIVAVPGAAAEVAAPLLAVHCAANKRIFVVSTPSASTDATAVQTLVATVKSAVATGDEYGGLVWPWVTIPDGSGGSRAVSPEGYVAGVRARAITTAGPQRAPGGQISTARWVLGTSIPVTQAQNDTLNDIGVICIRVISNTVQLYGWRSLSDQPDIWLYLSIRDLFNLISADLDRVGRRYLFENVDGRGYLLAQFEGDLTGVMEGYRNSLALYERLGGEDGSEVLDPGYSIDVTTRNTLTSLNQGKLQAVVSARPSPTAELVVITIVRAALAAAV